jgi:hypothetical protein
MQIKQALYGTKQTGWAWAVKLKGFLEEYESKACVYDPCCSVGAR